MIPAKNTFDLDEAAKIADLIANTSFLINSDRNKVQKLLKHMKKDKYRMMLFPQKHIAGRDTHYFQSMTI